MEPRSNNNRRPESYPQPKVEREETEAGPSSRTSQRETGSFNANSTITATASGFEHTNENISRTAAEAPGTPREESRSRDTASSATDNMSDRVKKIRSVVDDLWQLVTTFSGTVDYTKNNWAEDGVVGLDGGRLDDMSYLMSGAEGIPPHPFFAMYTRHEAVANWTTDVAPLLRAPDDRVTEDDKAEVLDLVTDPMITVLEDNPHRKQLIAWIDNYTRTGTHGLYGELMKLRERIQARLTTNVGHCRIPAATRLLRNENENPLLWLISELDQLGGKGKQMMQMPLTYTKWQQLAQTLTNKSDQILWVLHIFLSAYQAQHENEKNMLEEQITDLKTQLTISTRRHKAIVADHKDAKSMFNNGTARSLRSHIEELRESLKKESLEKTKAKAEAAYWKSKFEATSGAGALGSVGASAKSTGQTATCNPTAVKRKAVDAGLHLTGPQEFSVTKHRESSRFLDELLPEEDLLIASSSTEQQLQKSLETLNGDSEGPLRQDVFPGSSKELEFAPDDSPRQTRLDNGVADARNLEGFPARPVQMILLPSGRASGRYTVLDAIDDKYLLEVGNVLAEEYIALVAKQATAWTAIKFRLHMNRWKRLYLSVRKRILERVASNAAGRQIVWNWYKPEGDISDMLPNEELRFLARREEVELPPWKR